MPVTDQPEPTQEGWYRDPWRRHRVRWWDGGAWTAYAGDGVAVQWVTCIGAPLVEELFFRGLVQARLVGRYGAVVGIGVASLLFGATMRPSRRTTE